MNDAEDLATTALLGTGRTEDAGGGTAPAGSGAAPARDDPAAHLLGTAAQVFLQRRAAGPVAARPDPAEQPDEPAPVDPDAAPVPGPSAVARVGALLAGRDDELLVQWLRAAAAAGFHAPDRVLPDLLERAVGRPEVASALVPVIGRRGRWLAARRARWAAMVARSSVPEIADGAVHDAEQVWASAGAAERAQLLAAVRRDDPSRGRALLASTWAEEGAAEDRERLLRALAGALGPADEDFLERALDDRSRPVRERAAGLLARLPGSALSARARARCASIVRVERRLTGRRLVVDLPTQRDEEAVRDGVLEASYRGDRTQQWWLSLAVTAAPLAHWDELARSGPAGVLALPVKDGGDHELVFAWAEAAVRQDDGVWAEALVRQGHGTQGVTKVLPLLTQHQLVGLAVDTMAGTVDVPVGGWAVEQCPAPWPPGLAQAAVGWLFRLTPDHGPRSVHHRGEVWRVGMVSHRLPVDALPAVRALVAHHPPGSPWRSALNAAVATLVTRAAMLDELS